MAKRSEEARERWRICRNVLLKTQRQESEEFLVTKKGSLSRCKTGWWAKASAFGVVRSELGNNFEADKPVKKGLRAEVAIYYFLERDDKLRTDSWSTNFIEVCKFVPKGKEVLQEIQLTTKLNVDRTGMICTWPTSEIGAFFCFRNPCLFQSKAVIELGAGTGLMGLTVATCCKPASVRLTDGHPDVVDTLQMSSELLMARNSGSNCTSGLLNFDDVHSELHEGYDVCLMSDCLHTPDLHSKIAYCVKYLLKPGGTAYIFNPNRGGMVERFAQACLSIDLAYTLLPKNYDNVVWEKHLSLLSSQEWPAYSEEHFFPKFAIVTKAGKRDVGSHLHEI